MVQPNANAGGKHRRIAAPKNKIKTQKPRANPQNMKKRRKQNTSMLPIIAGITAAFLLIVGLCALYIFTTLIDSTKYNYSVNKRNSQFIGEIYDEEFKARMEGNYYRVQVESVYNANYAPNTIIDQSPKTGRAAKNGYKSAILRHFPLP